VLPMIVCETEGDASVMPYPAQEGGVVSDSFLSTPTPDYFINSNTLSRSKGRTRIKEVSEQGSLGLSPWNRALVEKLIVARLPPSMESEGSLPYSQKPSVWT
jgi:hypothetical protein